MIVTAPRPEDMLLVVTEAVIDLEAMQREIQSAKDSQTTVARAERANYWGVRAATRKRLAEVEFLTDRGDWRQTLKRTLFDYAEGLREGADVVDHWIIGQYVVLRSVLGETPKTDDKPDAREVWWNRAWRSASLGVENLQAEEQMWAHSSIADLLMVALCDNWPRPDSTPVRGNDVLEELIAMVNVVGGPTECRAVWPTFRQFWRWRYWWLKSRPAPEEAVIAAQAGFDYLWSLARRQRDI